MKENIKSAVVLTVICLVVAVLLAYTNSITAPVIEANKAAAASGSLLEVMPEAAGFEDLTPTLTNLPATVVGVYRETSGFGFVMNLEATSDYSGGNPMAFTIAINAEGAISAVKLTNYAESKDFGKDTYPQTYVGQNSTLADVTTVAGCTYSSAAFRDAVADAFTVLIENNLVVEAEKSEEQLIAETMPVALPSCCDSLGNCITTEIDPAGSATQAFKANNGTGYIYVMNAGSQGTVVVGVNAFGVAKAYNLEGTDVSADCAGLLEEAATLYPVLATENLENNTATAISVLAEGATLTPVEGLAVTETAVAAFVADVAGEVQYVVITAPLGYSNETMKMVTVFDAEGNVVAYKTLTELILHGEYYSDHQLTDASAYRQQFIGINEGTYTDDMTLVAGATMTAVAVQDSFHGAFEALNLIKEVVA